MSIAVDHFTLRASKYDRSSVWCTSAALHAATVEAVAPTPETRLLDVAVGTGLVSAAFRGKVAHITGVDVTEAMLAQGRAHVDEAVVSPAEHLPFADASFDRVVCRQGTQFMDDQAAVSEMVRVTKPAGRIVLVHLCAYGLADREEYFEILRLRNPARRNFYLREDLLRLLLHAGCDHVELRSHVSVEDVEAWADNGAIESEAVRAIRAVYEHGSAPFRKLHSVAFPGGRVVDHMLFGIAIGYR